MDAVQDTCDVSFPDLGKLLGSGRQGEVYDLGDRVLKIQVAIDEEDARDRVAEIKRLMGKDATVYPRIYEADVLCEIDNPGVGRSQGWAYYYVMEKLEPADNAEEVAAIVRAKISGKPIKQYMGSHFLDDALELYDRLEESGTVHVDVNPGNVMRTSDGILKLVDLDSVVVS